MGFVPRFLAHAYVIRKDKKNDDKLTTKEKEKQHNDRTFPKENNDGRLVCRRQTGSTRLFLLFTVLTTSFRKKERSNGKKKQKIACNQYTRSITIVAQEKKKNRNTKTKTTDVVIKDRKYCCSREKNYGNKYFKYNSREKLRYQKQQFREKTTASKTAVETKTTVSKTVEAKLRAVQVSSKIVVGAPREARRPQQPVDVPLEVGHLLARLRVLVAAAPRRSGRQKAERIQAGVRVLGQSLQPLRTNGLGNQAARLLISCDTRT